MFGLTFILGLFKQDWGKLLTGFAVVLVCFLLVHMFFRIKDLEDKKELSALKALELAHENENLSANLAYQSEQHNREITRIEIAANAQLKAYRVTQKKSGERELTCEEAVAWGKSVLTGDTYGTSKATTTN